MIEKIKETGVYFIGTIGVAILSFTISLLYTHMFTTDDYGIYSLIAALYGLFYQLFTGWMTHSILRYYPEEKDNENAKSLKNIMLFILLVASVIFAFIMMAALVCYRTHDTLKQMCVVYSGVFFFEGLLLIFNTFIRAEGGSKQYSTNMILNSVIKSFAIVVLYYVIGFQSITVIIVSLFIAEFVQSLYIFVKFKWAQVISLSAIKKDLLQKVVRFGYPLIFVSVIFNILTYSDRYIIKIFQSTSEVGLYSFGYNMGHSLFYTMTNAIMLGAYPRLTKEWVEKGRKKTEEMMRGYLNMFCYIMLPAAVGVIAVGNCMIQSLCAQSYWDSYRVFIITCISYTVYGFSQYTNKAWELTGNTKMIVRINIIAAVINIVLNVLLIPWFGYTVAAVTTLLSFVIHIFISLFFSRRIFTFCVDKRSILNIILASAIMWSVLVLTDKYFEKNITMLLGKVFIGVLVYTIFLIILRDKITLEILKSIVKKEREKN